MRRLADEVPDTAAEALFREALGAFELASGRDGAPVAVRAFNPVATEHGYQAGGAVLETNTDDLPFLVDSVSAELEGARPRDRPRRPPDHRHRARRPAGASSRSSTRATRARPSRSCTSSSTAGSARERARGARGRGPHGDRGRPQRRRATTRRCAQRVGEMIELARAGEGRYDADEVAETVAFLRWLLDGQLRLPRRARVRDRRRPLGVVPGLRARPAGRRDDSALAEPVPLESLARDVRERIDEGDLLIVSKSNRMSPVHRRARMDYVGVRRFGADGATPGESRMLGLFTTKAYVEPASQTPLLHRKLALDPRGRGPDRGLARLQGRDRALRLVPEGRAARRAGRGPAPRGRRAAGAAAPTASRVLGRRAPRRPQRVAHRRAAARRATAPRSASACASCRRARFGPTHVEPRGPRRGRPRADPPHRPRGPRAASSELSTAATLQREVCELTRTWDDRAARGARARATAERGRDARRALGARGCPSPTRRAVDPALAARGRRLLRALLDDRRRRSWSSACRRRAADADPRRRSTSAAARSSSRRRRRCSSTSACASIEERPTRLSTATAETWVQDFGVLGPTDAPLDLDAAGERIADTHRAPSGAARRSPTRSTGWSITTGLGWRQVEMLRAYRRYRQRIGSRFTESFQNDVIAAQPAHHREADAAVRAALRPGARARRGGRGRAARRDPRGPRRGRARSTTTASCATSSG